MDSDSVVVATERDGARVCEMHRVMVRHELPDQEGAVVVVDIYSEERIDGTINFHDLQELERYAGDHRLPYRTGEADPIGMARIFREVDKQQEELKARVFKILMPLETPE